MTTEARNSLRAETGMIRLLDLAATPDDVVVRKVGKIAEETGALVRSDGVRLNYRIRKRDGEMPSIRPVLVLSEGRPNDDAEKRAKRYLDGWRTVMTATLRPDDGTTATLARRAEDALTLARLLSHRNAGKTVEVYASGNAVAAAALMMALERGYFSVLEIENPPPVREGWPTWEDMAK